VETPTRNLESYFLEVVRKARESMSETSGATSGSTVAAYLRGDAEAAPPADKILERLTVPTAPEPAAAAGPRRPSRALTKPGWKAWPNPPPRARPSPFPCPLRLRTWAKPTKSCPPFWGKKDEPK